MKQLNLFSDKECVHCNANPGHKQNNPQIWNGFYDKDTGEFVCWDCQKLHYEKKLKTEYKYLYSEMPVVL